MVDRYNQKMCVSFYASMIQPHNQTVDCVERRGQVQADQDCDLLVIGCRVEAVTSSYRRDLNSAQWAGVWSSILTTWYISEVHNVETYTRPFRLFWLCVYDAGLGQHRLMPPGDYAQEKALKQEEKLISQLERLELTNDLIKVLRDQVLWLLDGKFSAALD